jgi:hypothetical protein
MATEGYARKAAAKNGCQNRVAQRRQRLRRCSRQPNVRKAAQTELVSNVDARA